MQKEQATTEIKLNQFKADAMQPSWKRRYMQRDVRLSMLFKNERCNLADYLAAVRHQNLCAPLNIVFCYICILRITLSWFCGSWPCGKLIWWELISWEDASCTLWPCAFMSDSDRDIPVMIVSACSLDFSPVIKNFFLTAWQEVSSPEGKRHQLLIITSNQV